jgi:iron complex outermembrane receptor protein
VATAFDQPDAQDPLGLTAAQVQANPRQAQPVAVLFNARRSLDNLQGGLILDSALSATDSLRFSAYAGSRSNEQYLAVPLDAQQAATSSGGVSVLGRDLAGAALRWTRQQELAGGPLTLIAGAEVDGSTESRQGYLNNLGVRGALKRDEDNDVDSWGAYLQAEWRIAPQWSLAAGVRYTDVQFQSEDRYLAPGNPDDSGSTGYSEWTPTVALSFLVTPRINLYASYGRAFETPTAIELAYRPDGASGLNFRLQPSLSDQYELGAKLLLGPATRLNLALYSIRTEGEIVIARNTGGRSSFQNAGDTSRLGAELLFESALGAGWSTNVALTLLNARFDSSFRSCAPLAAFCNPVTGANTAVVADGNRVPGIPNASLFADLAYRDDALGLTAALEIVANGSVAVNDFNSAYAAGYAIANLWAGLQQQSGRWRFREFVRVNNLFDRATIGAVVVGDANGRYYAPAPTRNLLGGVAATYSF